MSGPIHHFFICLLGDALALLTLLSQRLPACLPAFTRPMYQAMAQVFPGTSPLMSGLIDNYAYWESWESCEEDAKR